MQTTQKGEVRLLVADDDTAFRDTVIEFLEPYFETIGVESGERALEVVETTLIDLVLLDMHMHALNGLETIRNLRLHDSSLPCILMTSDFSEELQRQAHALKTFTVLRKPPRRDELVDTIWQALEL